MPIFVPHPEICYIINTAYSITLYFMVILAFLIYGRICFIKYSGLIMPCPRHKVYPKKYAHGFCFAVLCCGYTLTDFPYPSGSLHWHCGNLTIAPVPAKQPWWIWINTSCEFIMNDCTTTTKQSTTKPCAYFLGYTVKQLTPDCYDDANTFKTQIFVDTIIQWRSMKTMAPYALFVQQPI